MLARVKTQFTEPGAVAALNIGFKAADFGAGALRKIPKSHINSHLSFRVTATLLLNCLLAEALYDSFG